MSFLPVNRDDMKSRGWDELDFLFISGDAYIDHPSFGHAVISRVLENAGYKVGIIPQPDWENPEDLTVMGKPKYGILISAGVMDSMVNNFTASKHKRRKDRYSPSDGSSGKPDRALIVYTNIVRRVFKGTPVIIGGVEAGLRRFAHYDYWKDSIRRSVLFDSKADLLVFGPGEKAIIEIAEKLKKREPAEGIRGTAYISHCIPEGALEIPSFEDVCKNKRIFAEAFKLQYDEQDPYRGKTTVQRHDGRYLVSCPPAYPLTVKEMDEIYSLPYEREYHPMYEKSGGVKAIEEVRFSITSHRGCPGGCNFCSIVFHQGRIMQKRSKASILKEVRLITGKKDFKGYINDIGGPTANFRNAYCKIDKGQGMCKDKQCLYPEICKNLNIDHKEYLDILKSARAVKGVKKVFVKSGIRYDYLMADKNSGFLNELCAFHISGQLKVAPEHASKKVLGYMGKTGINIYKKFSSRYKTVNGKLDKKQYLVPYFISGHPGEEMEDVMELVEFLMDSGFVPDQIQDFYPTPGTVSTCMYYSGYDPRTMQKVKVARSEKERKIRRTLIQFSKPGNGSRARRILHSRGRSDLARRIRNK